MKKFTALLLALAMVFALAACGGGNTSAPASTSRFFRRLRRQLRLRRNHPGGGYRRPCGRRFHHRILAGVLQRL